MHTLKIATIRHPFTIRKSPIELKQTSKALFTEYDIIVGNYKYWKDLKTNMLDKMIQLWKTEWENSSKGRFTNQFFPNINDWFKSYSELLPRKAVHVLSGHSNSKLHRIGKAESSDCATCSTKDSPIHWILYCTDFDQQRQAAGITTDPVLFKSCRHIAIGP